MMPIPGKRYYVRYTLDVKIMKCLVVQQGFGIFKDDSGHMWDVEFKFTT